MTYMLLLNCALKLVEEIILYYDAWSKKHQMLSVSFNINHFIHCNLFELQVEDTSDHIMQQMKNTTTGMFQNIRCRMYT